jgi:epsin
MNLTEMESKVREATNNEPWGAPSTLMAQIAAGTYNYREREEIIGFLFRRFTEKAANEWRQIYKSLQLLDYLIKNGSERIIDDVRANLTLIQMLKSFHYIDSKGRDQGINVRNRAKNLIAFLGDDAMIRAERKKARANAKKFGGVLLAAFGGALSITPGGEYDDGDFTSKVYGDGGVYGERFDDPAAAYSNGGGAATEYDEYDPTPLSSAAHARATTGALAVTALAKREPEADLLGDLLLFDPKPENGAGAGAAAAGAAADDDDEFDDFQAAPSQPRKPNLSDLYQQPRQALAGAYAFALPAAPAPTTPAAPAAPAAPAKNDAFSSLFSSAKSKTKPVGSPSQAGASPASRTATPGAAPAAAPGTAPSTGSNSGEIDLLSF